MRHALAGFVVLFLLVAAPPGCDGAATCAADADCPAQHFCTLADGGLRGICQQECQATADCRDPARRCDSLGRCVVWELPPADAAASGADAGDGADAAPADDASGTPPADGPPADALPDDGAAADALPAG